MQEHIVGYAKEKTFFLFAFTLCTKNSGIGMVFNEA